LNATPQRVAVLLAALASVPIAVQLTVEANKRIVIGLLRLVDLADLIVLAPFYLVVLLALHAVAFPAGHGAGRAAWLSLALIGLFLYGHAMHLTANAIDTYAFEIHDYASRVPGDMRAQIHFLDELLGHWLMFGALLGLWCIWAAAAAPVERHPSVWWSGALYGVGLALAMIEGSQPWMGFVGAPLLALCAVRPWRGAVRGDAWRWQARTFGAFAVATAAGLVAGELVYTLIFGGFVQPSELW
jgi:hypothetical protein